VVTILLLLKVGKNKVPSWNGGSYYRKGAYIII